MDGALYHNLVVVASSNKGWMGRLFMGSVSSDLANRSPVRAVVVLHGRFYRAGVVSGIGSVASSGIGVAATVIGCPECGGGSPSECAQRVLQGRETDRCDG